MNIIRRHFCKCLLVLFLSSGWGAKMLFICPEEGGIVFESALRIDFRRLHAGGDPLLGKEQPLNGDVLPNGRSGSLLEYTQKMGLADIKPLGQHFQRQLVRQVIIDIINDRYCPILFGKGRGGLDGIHPVRQVPKQGQKIA